MLGRPSGIVFLTAALLAAGLAGVVLVWCVWARPPTTTPHAPPIALGWGGTYVVTALLTWRRSRFAAPVFLGAVGLLLPLLFFIFPGGQVLLLPWFVVTFLFAVVGYRYLRRRPAPAA